MQSVQSFRQKMPQPAWHSRVYPHCSQFAIDVPPLVPTPYDQEHSRCFPELSEAPLEADAPCLCFGGRVAAESLEKAGAARGIRTPDPIITNDVLYRLSYCGIGANGAGIEA